MRQEALSILERKLFSNFEIVTYESTEKLNMNFAAKGKLLTDCKRKGV